MIVSELLDAAIKAGDKIYFRGEKVESIEITRDKDEPPLKVDLAHTRASYLDTITEQLNENQQNLIIWMQDNECYTDDPLESISDLFLEGTPSDHFLDLPLSCVEAAYQSLTNQQKVEMVQKYLEQYLEQEEE